MTLYQQTSTPVKALIILLRTSLHDVRQGRSATCNAGTCCQACRFVDLGSIEPDMRRAIVQPKCLSCRVWYNRNRAAGARSSRRQLVEYQVGIYAMRSRLDWDGRSGCWLHIRFEWLHIMILSESKKSPRGATFCFLFLMGYILISTSQPAGKLKFISESIVFGVGSVTSMRRLWTRISNCSRPFL